MTRREAGYFVLAAAAFAVLACLPFAGHSYLLTLGVGIAMYTVLATSWALFSGPTHYISLATAAFFEAQARGAVDLQHAERRDR